MRRATIYARVSSDPNETGRSVEEQERECRQVAKREGWRVVRVFVDNDRSASRHAHKDRPAYRELVDFLRGRGADVLVMWEGSRAQRDLRDYLKLRDLCAERAILYCYSGRIFDLTRTDDRFNTGLDALLAERESDVTRDRVMRSVRANASAGRPHGKLLYGYSREYEVGKGSTGRVRPRLIAQVVDEKQAAVVREAAARVSAGEACRAIAADFNDRGVPAPRGGSWDLTQVRRLVTNPGYVAQRVHQGKVVGPADWPPILDEKTYVECVRRMTDPRRLTVQDATLKHLLSGALRCGVCGSRMRVQKNRGFLAYICTTGFCVSVKTTPIEAFITDAILTRLSQPDALSHMAEGDEPNGAAGKAAAEAAEKRALLDGFYASAADGKITPGGLAKIEARLLPQIEDAERRAHVQEVPPLLRELARPDAEQTWADLTIGQQREVISAMADLRIGRTVQGSRTFNYHRLSESRWTGDTKTWGQRWGTQS